MMDDFKPAGQNGQPDRPDHAEPANDPVPRPEERSQETMQSTAKPKKSNASRWLLGGLAVLLLAGAGAFSYWQWQEAENARREVSALRSDLSAVQAQNKKETATAAPTERLITTMELAERYAESYKGAGESIKFFTRVEKTDGDAALIYTKAEVPNAEPTSFVLKRVNDSVVVVDSFAATMSELQASMLKNIYGIDATRLGIKIETQ